MNYYLGIDGGGTKTAICIINDNLEIIDVKIGKPTSIDTVSINESIKNVEEIINSLDFSAKITCCFAGVGGISSEEDKRRYAEELKKIKQLEHANIEADNDIINALLAGEGKETGMVGIIGTGSVIYGDNGTNNHRCGGYCYQEGDVGSSFDLGTKALRYLARIMDKRYEKDEFSDILMKELNCFEPDTLIKWFQKSRTDVAAIAKIITKYDYLETPKKIIESAVEEIILMAKTVYRELNFDQITLSITGSLGNANTYYKTYLEKRMKEELPKVSLQKAKYEAYFGACLKAFYLSQK